MSTVEQLTAALAGVLPVSQAPSAAAVAGVSLSC
jgi:hypothetical protein